jgi:hypothetical protein
MTFNIDEEEKLKVTLKNIYSPVHLNQDRKQRMLNQLLENNLNTSHSLIRFDLVGFVYLPALTIIAIALIVIGYISAALM